MSSPSNPRSTLVEAFRRDIVDSLPADEREATNLMEAEATLERIEGNLRCDRKGTAIIHVKRFEESFGLAFAEIARETPGLEDPRDD